MTRYGQIGWRTAAIVAFVCTAVLAVTLTRAPLRTSAALSSELTSLACPTSGLEAWLGLGAGVQATGGTSYTLEFTNVSHRVCSLYGYPEVSAYTDSRAADGQIGGAAIRDKSVQPKPVMLAPGATAHSVLQVVLTGGAQPAGCAQVTADGLRVTLPHQARSAFVPVHIPVCSVTGRAPLSVQAIQARAGVPGDPATP
jgi:hypothetical protein